MKQWITGLLVFAFALFGVIAVFKVWILAGFPGVVPEQLLFWTLAIFAGGYGTGILLMMNMHFSIEARKKEEEERDAIQAKGR